MQLRLGVSAQDVAKVDVKQFSSLGHEEVVQVSVPDPQQVGDDAIAGAALDVVTHDFGGDAEGPRLAGCRGPEKVLDGPLGSKDLGDGSPIDELDESVAGGGGEDGVRGQLQVEVLLLQYPVEQGDDLQDQLVLPQVVAVLEYRLVPLTIVSPARKATLKIKKGIPICEWKVLEG